MFKQMKFINQIKKMQFSSNENEIFKFYDRSKKDQNELKQNCDNQKLKKTQHCYKNVNIFRIHQL